MSLLRRSIVFETIIIKTKKEFSFVKNDTIFSQCSEQTGQENISGFTLIWEKKKKEEKKKKKKG